MKLTDQEFWDNYWNNIQLPSQVNYKIPFDRCLAETLKAELSLFSGDVLEVGCAPGKWLAFLCKSFGMKPSGIEYSQTGMEATLRNFKIQGLLIDEIYMGDFFSIKPVPRFDLVISFGFIEHFDDPDSVIQRHLDWLKPGGKLVLGIPNFNGIYRPIQQVLDPSLLDKHNLSIMNLAYFRGLENILPISLNFLRYIGSFEPNLPIPKKKPYNVKQLLVKMFLSITSRIRKISYFDMLNHPLISSYILAIYTKDESE